MSDTSQGEGWWKATDGLWYSPDQLPEPPKPEETQPEPASESAPQRAGDETPLAGSPTEAETDDNDDTRKKLLISGGVFVVAVIGWLMFFRPPAEYKDVHGKILIDAPCDDLGGYSDIPNMQVIVRDLDGTALAALEPNIFNGTDFGFDFCTNSYKADSLPKLDSYIVDSGRRGEIIVSADDFVEDDIGGLEIFDLTIGG